MPTAIPQRGFAHRPELSPATRRRAGRLRLGMPPCADWSRATASSERSRALLPGEAPERRRESARRVLHVARRGTRSGSRGSSPLRALRHRDLQPAVTSLKCAGLRASCTRAWRRKSTRTAMTGRRRRAKLAAMTNTESTQQPRSTSIALLGGIRLAGRLRLPRRLLHVSLLGGMNLDLSQAEFTSAQLDIVKVSLLGGVTLVVPADVRVVVGGLVLLGGKDIERRLESSTSAQVVRVRSFGLIGGVRVRVAAEQRP